MNNDSKDMCRMRVKLIYTFSGTAIMAPIFIAVLGLNERNLLKTHHVLLNTHSLCVGGG